ncbi:DUF2004 domain-containing protein [Leifsonia sp. YAF41]
MKEGQGLGALNLERPVRLDGGCCDRPPMRPGTAARARGRSSGDLHHGDRSDRRGVRDTGCMHTTIATQRAGQLTFDTAEGYADDITFQTDNGPVRTWLHIFDAVSDDDTLLLQVSDILDAFPELLRTGNDALEGDLVNGGQVLPFVEFHAEELTRPHLDATLQDFRTGRINAEQVITLFIPKSFVLTRDDSNQLACWIDFILPPFESDQVLAVKFTPERTVKSIDWES